jgi:hypothetical protein
MWPLKIALTIGVCGLIGWSLTTPDRGLMAELTAFGVGPAVVVALLFLAAVVAYARDLHRLMTAIRPAARAARPGSVWWMLVLPLNFVEDFWIMRAVALSLRAEGAHHPARVWSGGLLWSGWGWCALQIGSLVPHTMGSLAGVLAVPLWLWHWRGVRAARADLAL